MVNREKVLDEIFELALQNDMVLAIVRRKYPQLRTVALTAEADEQFRSRAYALGVDLFWYKPATEQETKMFLECIESLLGRETGGGFRGMQSKSLMDIIQLECISRSSSVLRISNSSRTAALKVSAPPPGSVSSPASRNATSTSVHVIFSMRAMCAISTAVSALMWTWGCAAFSARNIVV